jgi:D-galactarolactone cycloisomerase
MMLERPIRRVEALVFRYPLEMPVKTSFGIMNDRPAVFVRIEDADGAVGWGEAWCNFPSVGAEHRARLVNEVLSPLLSGRTYETPRDASAELSAKTAILVLQSGEVGPLAQAIASIDIALWDLAAKRAEKPLWRFLGGIDPRVRVYASGINPDRPEQTVLAMRSRGHRAFKLKVGFGDDLDERNLKAIREEIGHDFVLAADANQAWDLQKAIQLTRRFEPYGLHWIEEPLRADRPWNEWNTLRQSTNLPLAAGENMASLSTFSEALAQGVFTVVQPDVAKWGGVSGCLAAAQLIIQARAMYCPHYLGGGIGLLASAHLLAAAGGKGMLEVDVNENPLRDEMCGPLQEIQDGHVSLGSGAGLGAAPDLKRLRRFQVSKQTLSVAQSSGWRRLLSKLPRRGSSGKDVGGKFQFLAKAGGRERYEPSKHYMRGPGPRARAALPAESLTGKEHP